MEEFKSYINESLKDTTKRDYIISRVKPYVERKDQIRIDQYFNNKRQKIIKYTGYVAWNADDIKGFDLTVHVTPMYDTPAEVAEDIIRIFEKEFFELLDENTCELEIELERHYAKEHGIPSDMVIKNRTMQFMLNPRYDILKHLEWINFCTARSHDDSHSDIWVYKIQKIII